MNPKVTDEMVERAARVLFERAIAQLVGVQCKPWSQMGEAARESWKRQARAVLEAAFGGDEDERD